MPTIFEVLAEIQRRPEIFVGWSPSERGKQLIDLETFLQGYAFAVRAHGIDDAVQNFPVAFSDFLTARYGWALDCGFVHAIRTAAHGDDDHAWNMLWTLVKEFQVAQTGKSA